MTWQETVQAHFPTPKRLADIGASLQSELEGRFLADQPAVEQAALALYRQSPRLAVDYLTEYSKDSAAGVVRRWKTLRSR